MQMLKLTYLEDINQLVIKTHTAEEIIEVCSCRISVDTKSVKTPTKEFLSKT